MTDPFIASSMFAQVDGMHAIAGLMVGLLVGLTGVGGGSLMTPLLVLMFGVSPGTAVGTDLLFAAATKVVGTSVHGWRSSIDWKIVRRLALGSIPATVGTLIALSQFGKVGGETGKIILAALGVMLIVTAVATIYQRSLIKRFERRAPASDQRTAALTILLGAILGVAVSISSVGAGAIGVTVLLILYRDLPVSRIVGTDIAHAVPLALLAGFGHWMLGEVDWTLLISLLCGSVPGVILGSFLSSRAPDAWLRPALAGVLLLSGCRLVF